MKTKILLILIITIFSINSDVIGQCTNWSTSPTTASPSSSSNSGYFAVYATGTCTYYAISTALWINNITYGSGGYVYYNVDANYFCSSRTGSIDIYESGSGNWKASFAVTQSSNTSVCNSWYTTPASESYSYYANTGSLNLYASGGTCGATYIVSDSWINNLTSSSGTSKTDYNIDANNTCSGASRTGYIYFYNCAGNLVTTFTITQSGSSSVPSAPTSNGNATVCQNTTANITVSPPSGSTIDWYGVSSGGSPLLVGSNTYSTTSAGNYYAESRNTTTGCTSSTRTLITVTVNSLPTITITGTTTVCSGIGTSLSASGGSTYSWSQGSQTTSSITVNPTTNTTYTVTGTDGNGCKNTGTLAITVNPLPNIGVSGTTTICKGSSSNIAASGGVSYSWSSGQTTQNITVTPNSTTSYTATGTGSNGCKNTTSISVTVNQPPTLSISSNSPLCLNQNINLTANLVSGATYNWTGPNSFSSASQNPTKANSVVSDSGLYHCKITGGNGCSKSDSIVVAVSPIPHASVTVVGATSFCQGDSTALTASIGNGYSWNTGATSQTLNVKATGNYFCSVALNGCTGNAVTPTTIIAVKPTPTIPIVTQNGSTLASSEVGTSYKWYLNGILKTLKTTQFITITSTENGFWKVTVTNSNNCFASSIDFSSSVGMSELEFNSNLNIYPNPSRGVFEVSLETNTPETVSIKVFNILGEVIYSESPKEANNKINQEINLSNASPGIYFLQLNVDEENISRKIIIEN